MQIHGTWTQFISVFLVCFKLLCPSTESQAFLQMMADNRKKTFQKGTEVVSKIIVL